MSTPPPTDAPAGGDGPLDLSICRKPLAGGYSTDFKCFAAPPGSPGLLSSGLMRFLPSSRTEEDETDGEPPLKMRKSHSSGESSTSQKSYKGSSPTPTASPGPTPSPSPPTSAGGS